LRGTRSLVYLIDMPRLLRSVRLALHHVRWINQRFPSVWLSKRCTITAETTDARTKNCRVYPLTQRFAAWPPLERLL